MLNGDVFVFDNIVHMYDLSDDNMKRPDSALDRQWHPQWSVKWKQQSRKARLTTAQSVCTPLDLGRAR